MSANNGKQNPRIHIEFPYEDENIIVYFIGDITFVKYAEIGYHTNPGVEICLIPSGKGFFKIHDKIYPIMRNQVFVTKAPQAHDGWPSREEPFRILYVCFKIKEAGTYNTLWSELYDKLNGLDSPITYDHFNMENIHQRLMSEVLNGGRSFNREIMENLLEHFVLLTLRNFETHEDSNLALANNTPQYLLSNKVMHYINEKIYEEIRLESISASLNYSIPHMCKTFKDHTGFSIMEYYNFARLEKAKKHLSDSSESISGISEKLKYSSIHHFSNSFKAFYGYSPNSYRKSAAV